MEDMWTLKLGHQFGSINLRDHMFQKLSEMSKKLKAILLTNQSVKISKEWSLYSLKVLSGSFPG